MSAVTIFVCSFLVALPACAQGPAKTDCEASGTVVNAVTGEPIARAMVSTHPGGAATNAKGEWSVTGQTCGRWMPTASRPGFITNPGPKNIEFVSGSPVRGIKLALMPEASVTGHVQDMNGDPVEDARITLLRVSIQNGYSGMTMNQAANTDQSGNFVVGHLQPGRYIICAHSNESTFPPGGGSALLYIDDCYPAPISQGPSAAMPIEGGGEVRVALTLRATPGLHVRGAVSGIPEGQRLGVGLDRVQDEGRMFPQLGSIRVRSEPIARDGTFDIANVTPGIYNVRAQLSPGPGARSASAKQRIQVGSSDVEGVQLRLEPSGSLNGTVRYELSGATTPPAPGQNPNQNLNINLNPVIPGEGGPLGQIQWDDNRLGFSWPQVAVGEYTFSAFAKQGTYVKSATLRGQDVLNQAFTVSGATGPLEIVVSDDTGTFNATVTDPDDHPATATIILKSTAGQTIVLRSDDDGVATRKYVPAGDYRVWAFDDISNVPWAEDEWMTQHAGPPTHITITQAGSGNVALRRTLAP